eukprot:1872772-Prorocentrum_lima.AAC.1
MFYLTRAQFDLIRQAMFTKKGKSKMSLTKAWWMKSFLHLQGTTLKAGQKRNQRIQRRRAFNSMQGGSVE